MKRTILKYALRSKITLLTKHTPLVQPQKSLISLSFDRKIHRRCKNWFSSISSEDQVELEEGVFHSFADKFLDNLELDLSELELKIEDDDFDLDNSQGVLNLNLGSLGAWVINKQTPNRQIWWSSPISGPMRFYYCSKTNTWLNTRDSKTELVSLLQREVEERTNVKLSLLSFKR